MFTNLLKSKTFAGCPVAFVLARIRGRGYHGAQSRSGLVSIRRELDREYEWIFNLLDDKTTELFTPFFCLYETERLVACLRMQRGRESTRIAPLLAESLISSPAKALLVSKRDHAEKVRGLVSLLEFPPDTRKRMERMLIDESWTDLEACFHEICLQWAVGISRGRNMRHFFQSRIDIRNLGAMHKALRWKSEKAPPWLDGGTTGQGPIRRFFEEGSLEKLEDFGRRKLAERSTGNFENDLIHGLAVRLHRQSRREGGLTLVLSHLWGLYSGLRESASGYGEVA